MHSLPTLLRGMRPGVLALALLAPGCRELPAPPPSLEHEMRRAVDGQRLRYLLFLPHGEREPAAGWPLLLFLHGAGERGDDLARLYVHGPPKLVDSIPALRRAILVAPQCPAGEWWRAATLEALLEEVRAKEPVDPARIYVTGLSMGGYGTWSLLSHYPGLFAAAVPISGGGDLGHLHPGNETDFDLAGLLRAKDVPIRAFHGADDPVIPVAEDRLVVDALRAAGGSVTLTVYPGVGHDAWTRTYADPALYTWLFAQRRKASATTSGAGTPAR